VGKGWAKGLTAATDARVARAAAAHRGKRYVARVPPELDRRRTSAPVRVHAWTPQLAYAVGLLATDGCLAGGKSVAFKSKDLELVELLLASLGKRNRITPVRTRIGGVAYLTQIGDVGFYRWLMTIGLSPRKSLTLGAIDVPDAFLLPLTRGLLDGDGSIMNKSARADTGRRSDYYWEYLKTKFVSASRAHVEWLQARLRSHVGVSGYIEWTRARDDRRDLYALRYGKRESIRLLPLLYADPDAPRLRRKWLIWIDYLSRHPSAR